MNKQSFYTNGKLLLSAEYLVLNGAAALALPVKYGQFLEVNDGQTKGLHWESFDADGEKWFEANFAFSDFSFSGENDLAVAQQLQKILLSVRKQNFSFLTENTSLSVKTRLTFPRKWGFGSSSTLIMAIARWGDTSPFQLLRDSFGGSGYDIACAMSDGPILYKLEPRPNFTDAPFDPLFKKQLYFVYLGKKQSSREGIARYKAQIGNIKLPIAEIDEITDKFLNARTLKEFEVAIQEHEEIVAGLIGLKRAKHLYFQDYWGQIKSLGAWGGDFVLATSDRGEEETRTYFYQRGFTTVLSYQELIL